MYKEKREKKGMKGAFIRNLRTGHWTVLLYKVETESNDNWYRNLQSKNWTLIQNLFPNTCRGSGSVLNHCWHPKQDKQKSPLPPNLDFEIACLESKFCSLIYKNKRRYVISEPFILYTVGLFYIDCGRIWWFILHYIISIYPSEMQMTMQENIFITLANQQKMDKSRENFSM